MKLFSAVVFFLLLAPVAHGATLSELQQMALANREIVEQFKANLEISEKDETIARSGYYPSFDVSYAANRLDESNRIEDKENSVAFTSLTWNVFSGFCDKYNIQSAKLLRNAEGYKLAGLEQDIQLAVAQRYLAIFDRQANLQVAENLHNTLLKSYQDAENIFEASKYCSFFVTTDTRIIKKRNELQKVSSACKYTPCNGNNIH